MARRPLLMHLAGMAWEIEGTESVRGNAQRHREALLNAMLLTGVLTGGVALAALHVRLFYGPVEDSIAFIAPYFAAWLALVIVWRWRGLGYGVRVMALLLLVYAVGFLAFVRGGPMGSGPVWLLMWAALTLTLLGPRLGAASACVALATYGGFALAGSREWIAFPDGGRLMTPAVMVGEWSTFALVVVGLMMALWWSNRGFLAALRDVEAAHRAARREASKSEMILQAIADGVIVVDSRGTISLVNDAVTRFFSMPADQIVGRHIGMLLADVDPEVQDKILHYLASPERRPIRFHWRDLMLSASFAPVSLSADEEQGVVSVMRDVTEQERLERARSSFFALAAHELRTPLNSIDGFTDFLRRGLIPESQTQQTLDRILVNTRQLRTLVDNLLSMAQDEAGKLVFSPGRVSLADLLAGVRSSVDVLAQVKGVELAFEIDGGVPDEVISDQQWLHGILVNLVGNAIKFTDVGSVWVRIHAAEADCWAMEVVDTGRGIAVEDRERIFEPFQIAGDLMTRDYRGAGLGLSIVKGLVERMGGRIDLQSAAGRGSTFTVTLPRVVEAVQ